MVRWVDDGVAGRRWSRVGRAEVEVVWMLRVDVVSQSRSPRPRQGNGSLQLRRTGDATLTKCGPCVWVKGRAVVLSVFSLVRACVWWCIQ
jgi:hypothetical protein